MGRWRDHVAHNELLEMLSEEHSYYRDRSELTCQTACAADAIEISAKSAEFRRRTRAYCIIYYKDTTIVAETDGGPAPGH